jgi:hypothetical protein
LWRGEPGRRRRERFATAGTMAAMHAAAVRG